MLTKDKQEVLDYFIKEDKKYSFYLSDIPKISYSLIIPTRNRAPYDINESEKNPLVWAFSSFLSQRILPGEIILINDASDPSPVDNTDKMAKIFREECSKANIKFIYYLNKERKNAAISRNIGARLAKNDILYYVDDDGVLRRDCSLGVYLFKIIRETDKNCFILNLPQNTRISHPFILISDNEFGQINEKELEITGSLISRFPKKYLNIIPTMRVGNQEIVKPLLLENFQGGNFIIDKKKLLSLGGLPDYGSEISYGEETGLALKAKKAGYKIYYLPYNNLAGIHLSYGNPGGLQDFAGLDWLEGTDKSLNLHQMVQESIIPRYGSGMRVEKEYYFYVKIRNFAILLEQYKQGLGERWLKKSYGRFVEKNDLLFQDGKGSVDDCQKRKKIWQLANDHAKGNKCFSKKELLINLKGNYGSKN